MAAGRHNGWRRRDSYSYSRRESIRYRNGACGTEFNWGGERDVGHSDQYRGTATNDITKFVGIGDGSRRSGGVVDMPPEKKRKFSPIIWDKVEKELVISSKNKAMLTDAVPATKASPESVDGFTTTISDDAGKRHPVEADVVEIQSAKSSVTSRSAESTISESRASSSSLSEEQFEDDDDQEQQQMQDVNYMQTRTISMSRWAFEGDSPKIDYDEDMPQKKEFNAMNACAAVSDAQMSSPECGEFIREDSAGFKSRSSGSAGEGEYSDCELDNNDTLEVVEDQSENDEQFGLYSDAEDDEMLNVPSRSRNMLEGCRSVFEYEKLNKINEGTYGVVYRAKDKKTGEIVALKKVKMGIEREGFPLTALREINILLSFHHPSIVNVKEVVVDDADSVYMVMEYMEHDLKGVMEVMKHPFSVSEVKCLMHQLLDGVLYLHDNWVLHRDLKSSNILLNNQGELKLCDFGMSRQYGDPLKPYTALVVTLWYRAPEVLLGAKQYSTAVDMWSVGCIMAELLSKGPLFQGKAEVDQLDKIFKILGTPNETIWPAFSQLPGAKAKFVKQPYNLLRKKFPATSFTGSPALSDSGFDLLNRLLTYDPSKRITAEEALNHAWFREVPLPKSKDFMPTFPAVNAKDRSLKPTSRR